ncbi:MAG TPA: protein kinase [Candidatus Polarisedimenticolaceae bacterium]|nr:protein kinase [Candidatus Polarisedimenticolaceae bacterium]
MSKDTGESFPYILRTGSMLGRFAKKLESIPPQLGAYRILEPIGEGGMGIVFLAEQAPPLARRVAIKVARTAVPDGRALARFESERQTLAVMNHPNIAQVFDAGSAPDARPYFVMEYVAGTSITDYCDTQRLGVEDRLELFVRVCDGVQHAHVNAVLHRDLKPSNILVTTANGRATPKIIDFGVAKALGTGAASKTGVTQFGQIVGTPEYMSPEQAALDGRPVDTRTDVYSLGVLLYELLAGSRPFERHGGRDTSVADLCRRIREDEPERPSSRAARTSATLARRLRGDLDAIVLKALSKDPASRYASPADLATDIGRHLTHRTIVARQPGALQRFLKVVRRHRLATAIVAALSVTLAALVVVELEAAADAKVANEVQRFTLAVMNREGPLLNTERGVGVVEGSGRGVLLSEILQRFGDHPVLLSQLMRAAMYVSAFDGSDRDFEILEKARARITSLLGPDHAVTIDFDEKLAMRYSDSGRFQQAEPILLSVIERRRRDEDESKLWLSTAYLAESYTRWGKCDEAVPLFEKAIPGLKRTRGTDDPDLQWSTVTLAACYSSDIGRYRDTQALLNADTLETIRRVCGARSHEARTASFNLGAAYAETGDVDAALRYLRDALDRGFFYPFGYARADTSLRFRGDPRFEELDRASRLNDPSTWPGVLFRAEERIREGQFVAAERQMGDLIAAIERVEGRAASDSAAAAVLILAKCRIRQRRFDDAERVLLPTFAAVHAEGRGSEWRILDLLAQCDLGRGRRESAKARFAAIVDLVRPPYLNVEQLYARAQGRAVAGEEDEALELLTQASALGFADPEMLENDLAFSRLRSRPEFQSMLKAARKRAL